MGVQVTVQAEIAELLRNKVESDGLDVRKLARGCGISKNTVYAMLRREHVNGPCIASAETILHALGYKLVIVSI
jgi:transcriptional regulator with XRE-family HTH domain